jgi:flagellar M-ring protein FliF
MRAVIDKMWVQLREYFGNMSKKNRLKLVILSLAVIVLAIVAVTLLSRVNYVTMHTAQTPAEAGEIYLAIQEMGIPVRIEGLNILVPEDRLSEIQALLHTEGVMGASGIDLSIMMGAAGFSVTDAHARQLYQAQRGSEIRTQILSVPRIQNAIVIVTFGESSPFRRVQGANQATATVMLTIRGGSMLSNQEAHAIGEIVKNGVPGIAYENITITDSNLNYYRVGDDAVDLESEIMSSRIALQNLLTQQIQSQAEQLLMPIFGMNNVKITPTLTLNWDRVVVEDIEFNPPVPGELGGIVRSSHELYEAMRRDEIAAGIPGTDENLMGMVPPEYPYVTLDDNEIYERRLAERNFEINQTTTVIEQAQGTIQSLNIAVLLNSDATVEDYTEEVANLVSRGFGVAPASVAVLSAPFSELDSELASIYDDWLAFQEQQRQRELLQMIIQWAVILLLGLALMTLIRTIVKGAKPPEPEPVLIDGGISIDYMVGDDDGVTDVTDSLEDVELQTKSTGLEQIEKFIERDPDAVAQLLRNWLSDE